MKSDLLRLCSRALTLAFLLASFPAATAPIANPGKRTQSVFRVEADAKRARILALSWDTEGGDCARLNLLRSETSVRAAD